MGNYDDNPKELGFNFLLKEFGEHIGIAERRVKNHIQYALKISNDLPGTFISKNDAKSILELVCANHVQIELAKENFKINTIYNNLKCVDRKIYH